MDPMTITLTTKSFNFAGTLPIKVFGFDSPKAARRICNDRAALSANAGYAGYMKRSSLWGWKLKIASHI